MSATLGRPEAGLLSAFAHELRTPLTALATSSGILATDAVGLDPERLRSLAAGIHERSLWLQSLIENLLCAAVVRDGGFSVVRRRIRLEEVVAEVTSIIEPLLARRGQRLRVAMAEDLPALQADSHRLSQVLLNLLANASKYGKRRAPIDVSAKRRGAAVRVMVADRGPGIRPEHAARLFDAFYRERGARRATGDGMGLGLAIVKWIVEAHDGTVGAVNRPGGGARFWFEIPVEDGDRAGGRGIHG